MPCVAHNLQLVIKDGFKLSDDYNVLIDKVSKNIVSKSKCSTAVAEELRELNKKLCKRNLTRWNSTLFMIRSVLKLTPFDFTAIKNNLPIKSKKQRELKKNFNLSEQERAMLHELKEILEMFEFVTDEIQTNDVSISRVFPCINYLKSSLAKASNVIYTEKLRSDLLKSINERFKDVKENDIYIFSTFLDPQFGIAAFEDQMKLIVKAKVSTFLKLEALKNQVKQQVVPEPKNFFHNVEKKRNENYIFYENNQSSNESDGIEREIEEFVRTIRASSCHCPLEFWKTNQLKFPLLSKLAKKLLGIPASSAAVERMFSISGHIFSLKRRRMGVKIFAQLVFLKLNENLL